MLVSLMYYTNLDAIICFYITANPMGNAHEEIILQSFNYYEI